MKRIKDGRKVVRGQIESNTYLNRIHLFDGKFTTGYRIVGFHIVSEDPLLQEAFMATVSTEPKSAQDKWDYSNVEELAWAKWTQAYAIGPTDNDWRNYVEANMVVEDLWIGNYCTTDNQVLNYEIVLDKYVFPAWDGAGVLVQNLSQAGPSS